ncbi:MAG TPA: TetR/AcrR family transcriptional regulator [Acidimicrobiales bacterium]|jgi:AcrR family transcriptional regulator|nr:TetR/AcrR family transcriptional regulator [Acidimicrobiales bacterium]
MAPTTTDRSSARDRLLAAANELFYEEGVHTVGIDRVIERAGVAKATLYSTFGSKDELIRSYLDSRYTARKERISKEVASHDTPRERLLSVFDVLSESISKPGYHGCAFINASAEADLSSPILGVVDAYRTWLRTELAELADAAGAGDPGQLARQLMMLFDGAGIAARIDGYLTAATAARATAATLLDAAIATKRSGPAT